jgi:hypothetical protein
MLKRLKKQKGISLVILIIMVVFVGITVVGIHAFLAENVRLSDVEKQRARALYLAEMGISDSFWELKYSEKLYGLPTQPYGRIDLQTVNFFDGTSGTYEVPEPTDSIVSTGIYGDITRMLKVGINYSSSSQYVFFAAGSNDFTFDRNAALTGNAFVNGSVTVTTPTDIDTTQMTLYLPSGESASYSGGGNFPYTTIDPVPTSPDLSTTYYDNLISLAQSQSPGDVWGWFDMAIGDTVLINGNVLLMWNVDITTTGTSSIVVVTGNFWASWNVTFSDSIQLIVNGIVYFDQNCSIGTTTGRSGNLIYSNSQYISLGRGNTINGAIVSNNNLVINRSVTINGLTYVKNESNVDRNANINGCIWSNSFTSNRMGRSAIINWNPDYLPSPLPPGVSQPGSAGTFSLAENSWKEL